MLQFETSIEGICKGMGRPGNEGYRLSQHTTDGIFVIIFVYYSNLLQELHSQHLHTYKESNWRYYLWRKIDSNHVKLFPEIHKLSWELFYAESSILLLTMCLVVGKDNIFELANIDKKQNVYKMNLEVKNK